MTTDEARRDREQRIIEQGDAIDAKLSVVIDAMNRRRRRDLRLVLVLVLLVALALSIPWYRQSQQMDCLRHWADAQQSRSEAVGAAYLAEREATKVRDRAQQALLDARTEASFEALRKANAALNAAHETYDAAQQRLTIQDVGSKLRCA